MCEKIFTDIIFGDYNRLNYVSKCVNLQNMSQYRTIISPLGAITLSASGGKLIGVFFGTKRFAPLKQQSGTVSEKQANNDIFNLTERWLHIYFSGHCPDVTPEFELIGSDFQIEVWKAILKIPYGQTRAYSDIERYLERKNKKEAHALAVGSATGKNNLAIIVPCHRVIRANGNIGEYNAGVFRKQRLLAYEGVGSVRPEAKKL